MRTTFEPSLHHSGIQRYQLRGLAAIGILTLALSACGTGVTEEPADTAPTISIASTTSTVDPEMDTEDGVHEHTEGGTEWLGNAVPTIEVEIVGDAATGWTVTAVIGDSFTFGSPDDTTHQAGVGHAHLVIDGHVAQMIYEPTAAIETLEPGMHTIEVRLASSDHSDYLLDGEFIAGMTVLEVLGDIDPADVTVEASFADGVVTAPSDRVAVALGDIVEIVISSDVAEEIHVHGYDIVLDVGAGESVILRFTAEVPGIFEVELEESGLLLLELIIS